RPVPRGAETRRMTPRPARRARRGRPSGRGAAVTRRERRPQESLCAVDGPARAHLCSVRSGGGQSMNRMRQLGALVGLALSASLAAAAEPPDFTGIWDTYREPGAARGPFRPAPEKLPLKPDAQKKVDAYRALIAP